MPATSPVFTTALKGASVHRRGKVRDMYELGDQLLMVATDRISAYDVVLDSLIPDKGAVLTQLSAFWFTRSRDIVPNHMVSTDPATYPAALQADADMLAGRRRVRCARLPGRFRLARVPRERPRLRRGAAGRLRESDRLPRPIFTPATKAETGHDINISEEEAGRIVGAELVARLRDLTLELYAHGAAHAEQRGIIVADTKFEFGLAPNGAGDEIVLIDEALTPDSSRFWPKDRYAPGRGQASFDKQYVRDYLDEIQWNRQPPAPELPPDIVERTRDKYREAYRLLTGTALG